MTCTASGLADDLNTTGFTTVPGLCGGVPNTPVYENIGSVSATGSNSGTLVRTRTRATTATHSCRRSTSRSPPTVWMRTTRMRGDAPQVAPGGLVTWTYVVTNTGNEPLNNINVVDDQGVPVSCPAEHPRPGRSR